MNLRTILILGALSAFGPLAIDFYLPGFPAMALAFATDEKHIQTTLAAYFLGLSLGQLAYGPVADRFGRRIPLLVGVTLFVRLGQAVFKPNKVSFPCPTCGESISLFGTGGGEETARRLSELVGTNVPLLGKVPFSPDLRTGGDNGAPVVVQYPESAAAKSIIAIVDQLVVRKKSLLGVRLGVST